MSLLPLVLGVALAGQGLQIDHVQGQPDKVMLRVELTDAGARMAAKSAEEPFLLSLDHGQIQSTTAHRISGDEVLTLLALDQSGSFRTYREDALGLARAYVRHKREGERVGLVLFGLSAEAFPTTDDEQQALGSINAATLRPTQRATRLNEFIRQAAARAHQEHPPSEGGLRQIVVFTDGGEESRTWSVDEVAEELRDLDVQVHVVAFYQRSRGDLASRLDDLSRMAALTGGTYLQVESVQQAEAALIDLAASSGASWEVEALVCGQPPGGTPHFTNHVVVRFAPRGEPLAWSDAVPFEQITLLPCAALAPAQAQQAARAAEADAKTPRGPSPWACVCPSAALLLAVLAVVALAVNAGLSRSEDEEEEDELTPTPPPRRPATSPTEAPLPGGDTPPPPLASQLPETHLVAVHGSLSGQRWRFRGRRLTVGAAPDNDVVLDLEQISAVHALFELFPKGDVYLTDQGSTNGTWVEGERLVAGARTPIHPGQRIALSSQLIVEIEQPGRAS